MGISHLCGFEMSGPICLRKGSPITESAGISSAFDMLDLYASGWLACWIPAESGGRGCYDRLEMMTVSLRGLRIAQIGRLSMSREQQTVPAFCIILSSPGTAAAASQGENPAHTPSAL